MSNFHYANLAFLANYGEGTTNAEIESEIYRAAFQVKGATHYDRNSGGSFQDTEQEPQNTVGIALILRFSANLIESIAEINENRNNNPYITLGFADIITKQKDEGTVIQITYRLLQDLVTQGSLELEL